MTQLQRHCEEIPRGAEATALLADWTTISLVTVLFVYVSTRDDPMHHNGYYTHIHAFLDLQIPLLSASDVLGSARAVSQLSPLHLAQRICFTQ